MKIGIGVRLFGDGGMIRHYALFKQKTGMKLPKDLKKEVGKK